MNIHLPSVAVSSSRPPSEPPPLLSSSLKSRLAAPAQDALPTRVSSGPLFHGQPGTRKRLKHWRQDAATRQQARLTLKKCIDPRFYHLTALLSFNSGSFIADNKTIKCYNQSVL